MRRTARRKLLREKSEQRRLAFKDARAGFIKRKPFRSIDLRKARALSAARRPFHFEQNALDIGGVKVALRRERLDNFSTALLHASEWRKGCGRRDAELFEEFASRRGLKIFPFADFALGNRPRAEIALSPVWAAGMNKQDLDPARCFPVEQNAR